MVGEHPAVQRHVVATGNNKLGSKVFISFKQWCFSLDQTMFSNQKDKPAAQIFIVLMP